MFERVEGQKDGWDGLNEEKCKFMAGGKNEKSMTELKE